MSSFTVLVVFVVAWIVIIAPFMFLALWLLKPVKGQRFDFASWFYLGAAVSMLCSELMGEDMGGICTFILVVVVAWIRLPVWTGEKVGDK